MTKIKQELGILHIVTTNAYNKETHISGEVGFTDWPSLLHASSMLVSTDPVIPGLLHFMLYK